MRVICSALVATSLMFTAAQAAPISFDKSWKEQRFSLFSKNRYSFNGNTIGIKSNGSVSMAYVALPEDKWSASTASWTWSVKQSVPPTDLTVKGGDDRNIALYAIFLPKDKAASLKGASIKKLLSSDDVRVIVYVWGGDHGVGAKLDSPYLGPRGKTVVLRAAGTGQHSEKINLKSDYKSFFGSSDVAVVGLAISADSDDTDTSVDASIANLNIQ